MSPAAISARIALVCSLPLVLAGCAGTASNQAAANSPHQYEEPATGSLIGGLDGGADQNTNAPDVGYRNNVSGGGR